MRDIIIIAGVLLLALAIGLVLFFYVPPNPSAPQSSADSSYSALGASSPVPFAVLGHGANAPDSFGKVNYRITNANQLSALWSMVYGDNVPPPSVDFSSQEVLAVFDGSHATGGYTIAVASVADTDSRTVTVEHGTAGSGCMTTAAESSPFEIVSMAKTVLPIVHEDTAVTASCQ